MVVGVGLEKIGAASETHLSKQWHPVSPHPPPPRDEWFVGWAGYCHVLIAVVAQEDRPITRLF